MIEATPRATNQNARKQRNDRLVRRLTTTATTFAIGLAGVLTSFSASAASPHLTTTAPDQLSPAADAALAKAIAHYASAAAPRPAATPSHPAVATAPRPVAVRHPAIAVSGGS
jgi:hypothetical protein